jgi:hypothetical protein
MVPDKLITADCHIAPPYELINELPESYREYFPRIEKDENGKDVFKAGHIVTMGMMTGEGVDSDITADATGAVGNVVAEAHPSFDAAEQLADLERDGVYGAVLIGRISDMPTPTPPTAKWSTTGWPRRGDHTWTGWRPVFTCRSRTLLRASPSWSAPRTWDFAPRCCPTASSNGPTTWKSGSRCGRPPTAFASQ